MTSTSRKVLFFTVITMLLTGLAAGYYYNDAHSASGFNSGSTYSLPHYDSQEDFVVKLVIPFMVVAIILQRGFENALKFTLADDDSIASVLTENDAEKKRIRKQSLILSLLITAMAVPTPYWKYIQDIFIGIAFLPAAIMGVLGVIVVFAVLLIFYFFLTG